MKIAYITAYTPFGWRETFILEEMRAMVELGAELVIVPRNPPKEVFHDSARGLLERAIWQHLLDWRISLSFLKMVVRNTRLWKVLSRILRHSRTPKILVKNLAVAPKAVYIAGLLRQAGVEHIHAHWGSTTATMAWIASELTGIPWSMTVHRWDIAENNMLKLKVEEAAFVRCISEAGRQEVLRIVGNAYQGKLRVLHMGVRLPISSLPQSCSSRPNFVVACPANLLPVKGHRFLIDACALLVERGIKNLQCLLIGDGPLEHEIRQQVAQLGLEEVVKLVGRIPHGDLMRMYEKGEVDVVVLPSIVTADGEKEGIPVALMEAMAYGIPVISTPTGGIPELLQDGAGLIVPPGSPDVLAEALVQLLHDGDLRGELGYKGYQRVRDKFSLYTSVEQLLRLISQSSHPAS